MTQFGLGLMMVVLLIVPVAVVGYFTRHQSASSGLWKAAAASLFAGAIGNAVVQRFLGDSDPSAAHRIGFEPLAFPLMLLGLSLAASVYEQVSSTRYVRAHGYPVRFWWPTWVPVSLWLAAVCAVPFVAQAVIDMDWAQRPMPGNQAEIVALAMIVGTIGLMLAGLVAGAVHVFVWRPRRIDRDLAPVYADIAQGRFGGVPRASGAIWLS